MNENYFAVILAGGGGTRLWPLSRHSRPKQMLPLIDERTLFQIAVQRLSVLFPPERILVVTNDLQSRELLAQSPELKEENFLLEPEPRGTAAAIGLAAAYLQKHHPDTVMAVLTADHYIGAEDRFIEYLRAAKEIAMHGHLVTLGIDPTYPATQYGYIQLGEKLNQPVGVQAFVVRRFKEKPAEDEARQMIADGEHCWNSGMFIWQVQSVLREFERQMPDLYAALEAIAASWNTPRFREVLEREWAKIPNRTIDYGVMENAQNLAVIPAKDMRWNDVGSWNSLFEVLEPDENGNVVLTEHYLNINSTNSLVHTNGQSRMVVTVGIKDLVVVDTGDVLFICTKDRAQDVRQVIELLKENKLKGYL